MPVSLARRHRSDILAHHVVDLFWLLRPSICYTHGTQAIYSLSDFRRRASAALWVVWLYGTPHLCVLCQKPSHPHLKHNLREGSGPEGRVFPSEPITAGTPGPEVEALTWCVGFFFVVCGNDDAEVFGCANAPAAVWVGDVHEGKLKIGRVHLCASCLFTACGTAFASPPSLLPSCSPPCCCLPPISLFSYFS